MEVLVVMHSEKWKNVIESTTATQIELNYLGIIVRITVLQYNTIKLRR